ncbi:MAG: ribulose-phosphate 3-epimerase [Candidatus Lightella neohaematopini]|nr:ribulose-phosphate 3-epimerase [Candidatus Lightella neohaematopini]MCV2528836.1 ribulose-phosphate 3-epimerase [Candidatus Lightella neohaematopini]
MKNKLISASIISANFALLGQDIENVVRAGIDLIHFDVMDNHYVPNLTIGPLVLRSLRNYGINIPVDVHLMANPVESLILEFAKAGANYISFHVETTNHIDRLLQTIKNYGCKAGLAFNPSTPLSYLEYVIDKIDLVLIMSVNPGYSSQLFIPSILNKIKQLNNIIMNSNLNIDIAVDGGIKLENIEIISKMGANIFIIGSEIFNSDNYFITIKNIKSKIIGNNI